MVLHNCTWAAFITAEICQAKLLQNRWNFEFLKSRSTSRACSSALERKFKNRILPIFSSWIPLQRGLLRIYLACPISPGELAKYCRNDFLTVGIFGGSESLHPLAYSQIVAKCAIRWYFPTKLSAQIKLSSCLLHTRPMWILEKILQKI